MAMRLYVKAQDLASPNNKQRVFGIIIRKPFAFGK